MATVARVRTPDEDLWYGTHRPSMKTNVLLQHVSPGKVKCTTFQRPPEDKVFGIPRPLDPEGAREVIGIWKQHQPNPFSQPGPDFRAMNKQATIHGLTTPHEQHDFRALHPMHLKVGYAVKQAPPQLPSDKKPQFTYGKPSTHKTMEEIRVAGRDNPNMKHLMQGAYTWEWMQANDARAQELSQHAHYIEPTPTKAALGHSRHAGAQDSSTTSAHAAAVQSFKLSKFLKSAKHKVNDAKPAVMDTIRPIRDVRIHGQTQAALRV